jgi:hypothetical protein
MGASPGKHEGSTEPPNSSTVILMLTTIGDTTWRMFIPTIGLFLIGMWADGRFGTKPWAAICGLLLGSVIAGLLVRNQLRNVRK